ncbi:hypothetical protein [Coleofasciculus sp.]|uniref:hypothetical protein n=1 Tax=Coleofasciculus sp. TaxID=3100458 RepID=UPI0039F8FC40
MSFCHQSISVKRSRGITETIIHRKLTVQTNESSHPRLWRQRRKGCFVLDIADNRINSVG